MVVTVFTFFVLKIYDCFSTSLAQTVITQFVTKDEPLDPLRQTLWCPTFQIGTQCPVDGTLPKGTKDGANPGHDTVHADEYIKWGDMPEASSI
uniref:Secreted protein n=1 Tax=Angiostrongylus cantonensis TaxID=6313 RepID=A0A0K0DA38_ANGCA